jgi:phytoene synthase
MGDGDSPVEQRRLALQDWRESLVAALRVSNGSYATGKLVGPAQVFPALAASVQEFAIPSELLVELVDGVMLDLDHQPPENWQATEHYCYLVASTVGLACTHVWKRSDAVPVQAAIECGYAFQITNMLRDVAEDARWGRIYLPRDELARFGVDTRKWLRGQPDGDWQALVDDAVARADKYYEAGWLTIDSLTPDSKRMFSLIWHSYRELLRQVACQKERIWTRRISLSRFQKCRVLVRAMIASRRTK